MSTNYRSPRKSIPIRIEKAVLAKSRRRCTLCFGLSGDLTEKRGQIAHLDGNRNNNAESNLAWMCLDHHSLFDSTTKQHKNYTVSEAKEYRRLLYRALRSVPQRSARRSSASKPKKAKRVPQSLGSNAITSASSPTPEDSWLDLFQMKRRLEAEVEALEARPDLDNVSIDAPVTAVRVMTRGEMRRVQQIDRKKKDIALINEKLKQGMQPEEHQRFVALEELAGQLVEELASHWPLRRSMIEPMLEQYRQGAGRFARYDNVRRAILQLQNSLDRMYVAKRDHDGDQETLRSELDRDLKTLLSVCDSVTEREQARRQPSLPVL
jgi:hypothetical protein